MRHGFKTVWAILLVASSSICNAQEGFDKKPVEAEVSIPTQIDWTFILGPRSLVRAPKDWKLEDYTSAGQSYQLYIPESYDPDVDSGLILFISPTNRAMGTKTRWKAVCDELGFILAAPHNAGNDVFQPVRVRIVMDVLDDVRRKFGVDPDRTYVSGFSGGGRTALAIAFALPEYFGGVIPIGATGELRNELWLRDRIVNRLSVAHLIGAEDFNFIEVTEFRGPLMRYVGIREKTWVVPGLAHEIPESNVLTEAVGWLEESLGQRRDYAKKYPASRVESRKALKTVDQADALFEEAMERLDQEETFVSGQLMLKGIAIRWPELRAGRAAASKTRKDESWKLAESSIMRDYLFQRTRGLDAYATKETHEVYADQKKVRLEAAIMSWSNLIKAGKNQKAIEEGTERIKVLQKLLEEISPGSSNNQK